MRLNPTTEIEILLTLLATQTALMHALALSTTHIPPKESVASEQTN